MSEVRQPRCYEDLLEILRGQMDKLGVGINQVDEICGLPQGYAAKIFGPSRTRKLGHKSLWLLAPELGIRIELHEDAQLLEKRRAPSQVYEKKQARFGNESQAPGIHVLSRVLRHIGRIGGKNRMGKMRKSELRAHQQNAANARWKRRRAKRVRSGSVIM